MYVLLNVMFCLTMPDKVCKLTLNFSLMHVCLVTCSTSYGLRARHVLMFAGLISDGQKTQFVALLYKLWPVYLVLCVNIYSVTLKSDI